MTDLSPRHGASAGESQPAVVWYRRLTLRLAGLLALTLLLFDFVSPYIVHGVFRVFGIPSMDEPVTIVTGGSPFGDDSPFGDAIAFPTGTISISDTGKPMAETSGTIPAESVPGWMEMSRVDSPAGSLVMPGLLSSGMSPGALDSLSVVKTDLSLVVLDARGDAPVEIGQTWSPALLSRESPSPFVPISFEPSYDEAQLVGWTIVLAKGRSLAEELGAELGQTLGPDGWDGAAPRVMDAQEFQSTTRNMQRLGMAVSWLLTLTTALVLAWLVSRLVTRRLTDLASKAALPIDGENHGIELFDASGADEISMLARSLNDARKRNVSLVGALDERDQQRCEWIAQVSHDLRTPLTALLACLERARGELSGLDDTERKQRVGQALNVANMDADRVLALADDLLEIGRLDARADLNREAVLPGELVERCVTSLEPFAASRGVTMEATYGAELPVLDGDGHRLTRALENLLRNAIQHAAHEIAVDVTADADTVRLAVRDDGTGFDGSPGPIDLTDFPRKGGRADSAGLGLTVACRVAEAHGGHAGAANLAEGGAEVWLQIPVQRRDGE